MRTENAAMIQPNDIYTLTDFKRKSTELIEKLEASGRPQVLTVEGLPKVVVMGVESFERMANLAERSDSMAKIRRGVADAKSGRITSARKVFKALRRKSGSSRRG
jgi:prevent-host-death family protein